ncbi:putative DEAD/DEAH box helicase-like protein [Leptomonas seymouri]|uniref:DNA 3'-5' helicase n=1 Tax=Leptomonas seymouri TaxID=5684 RepID=A0A0N1PDT3_LEPSE|nr:putative DEAD/DEAH box helicase-like protein [Leptomonas seymouri]|eukprot:KPI90822.1 putative DEAD/DEAH box helicase-like protein [Leptomonas seymouri]
MSSPAVQSLGSLLRYLPYQNFNKVQEAVIPALFTNDRNCLIAAPTGSGKTVLLEVAMLRLFRHHLLSSAGGAADNGYAADNSIKARDEPLCGGKNRKAVYICPIKALANEKYEHWRTQFPTLSVVIETGDQMQQRGLRYKSTSDNGSTGEVPAPGAAAEDMLNVSQANILVTTPERWDSITRRWKETEVMAIVNSVALLLLDEVHTVQEERGAAMEAIVSRVKAIQAATAHDAVNCAATRIVAISGTLPNILDMAEWLGVSPEMTFAFSAADRPVPLTIKVISYAHDSANPFAFHRFLSFKLFSLIQQFSEGKPTLVFCASRKEVTNTAAQLVEDIRAAAARRGQLELLQPSEEARRLSQQASDKQLRCCLLSGVGYHHAAMAIDDRLLVERMFREQYIAVVCSTTTLALGVNLPAHLVVIKGSTFFANGQCQDVSVSEVMQMCGRAGRPGLDAHGVALVLTTQRKSHMYDTLRNGTVTLTCVESHLHQHMIEHVNAEVALRTIQSFNSALEWAKTTYFWIRLRKCPQHYGLEFASKAEEDEFSAEAFMEALMERVLRVLAEEGCISIGQAANTFGRAPALLSSALESAVERDRSVSSDRGCSDIGQPGIIFESTRLGRAMARMYILFDTVCFLNSELKKRGLAERKQDEEQQQSDDASSTAAAAEGNVVKEGSEEGSIADSSSAQGSNSQQKLSGLSTDSTVSCAAARPFTLQEALQLLCQCQELVDVRLRQGDRGPLNEINRAVRFPLRSGRRGGREVREEWHKAYLLIQASVGLLPITEVSLRNDATRLWSVVPRVSRFLEEYASAQTSSYSLACCANVLSRCIERRVWPDGPVLRQLPYVNEAVAKSLLRGGYRGFDTLRNVGARQLEVLCSRLPPFGSQVLAHVQSLPQLEVELLINVSCGGAAPARRVFGGCNGVGTVRVFLSRCRQNEITSERDDKACSEPLAADSRGSQSADTSKRRGCKSALTEFAMRDGRALLIVGAPAADVVLLKRFVPISPLVPSGATPLQMKTQPLPQMPSGEESAPSSESAAHKAEIASFTFSIPFSLLRCSGVPDAKCKIEARCFVLHMVGLDVAVQAFGEVVDAAARSPVVITSTATTPSADMNTQTLDQYWTTKPRQKFVSGHTGEENCGEQRNAHGAAKAEQRALSAQIAAEARDSFDALLVDMAYVASDSKHLQKPKANRERKRSRHETTDSAEDTFVGASAIEANDASLQIHAVLHRRTDPCEEDTRAATEAAATQTAIESDASAAASNVEACFRHTGPEGNDRRPLLPPLRQARMESVHRHEQSPVDTTTHLQEESEAGGIFSRGKEVHAGQPSPLRPPSAKKREGGIVVRLPRCPSPPATRPPSPWRDSLVAESSHPNAHGRIVGYASPRGGGCWGFPDDDNMAFQCGPPHPPRHEMDTNQHLRWRFAANAAPLSNSSHLHSSSVNERPIAQPNPPYGFHSTNYGVEKRWEYENSGIVYAARAGPRSIVGGTSGGSPYLSGECAHPQRDFSLAPARWPPHAYSQGNGAEWWGYPNVPSAPTRFPGGTHFPVSNLEMNAPPYPGRYPQRQPQPACSRWAQVSSNGRWSRGYTQHTPPPPPISFLQAPVWESTLPYALYEQANVPSSQYLVQRQLDAANRPPMQFASEAADPARSSAIAPPFPCDIATASVGLYAARSAVRTSQQSTRGIGRAPSTRPAGASSTCSDHFTPHVRRSAMVSQSWWQ